MNCFLKMKLRFVFLLFGGFMDFKELYAKERPYAIEVLKKLISQSVYGKPDELDFGIEMHRLKEKVSELGLIPVRFTKEVKSKK